MKNLTHIPEEKLDDLPKRVTRDYDDKYYRRHYFPYNHAYRWINSKIGQNANTVFSEYVKQDWVPTEYRNHKKFSDLLETNTFMKDGKVFYFDPYLWRRHESSHERPITELGFYRGTQAIYIHPVSNIICAVKKKKQQPHTYEVTFFSIGDFHQLSKVNGIWYEIWAENVTYRELRYFHPNQDLTHLVCNRWARGLSYDEAINAYMYRPRNIFKQQLSHKGLVKYGLHNESPVVLMEEDFKKRFK